MLNIYKGAALVAGSMEPIEENGAISLLINLGPRLLMLLFYLEFLIFSTSFGFSVYNLCCNLGILFYRDDTVGCILNLTLLYSDSSGPSFSLLFFLMLLKS